MQVAHSYELIGYSVIRNQLAESDHSFVFIAVHRIITCSLAYLPVRLSYSMSMDMLQSLDLGLQTAGSLDSFFNSPTLSFLNEIGNEIGEVC